MDVQLIKHVDSARAKGILSKAWYSVDGKNCLVKGNSFYDGQIGYEPYAEVMASHIAKVLGFPHVNYVVMPAYVFPEVAVFGVVTGILTFVFMINLVCKV